MYFVFDTETTGLPGRYPVRRGPSYKDLQRYDTSRLLSIAWIILDENMDEKDCQYYMIKPQEDVVISKESTEIHGITREVALRDGESLLRVLDHIQSAIAQYKCKTLVAHNLYFDRGIITSEAFRAHQHALLYKLLSMERICTMLTGKQHMNVSKFPKLRELYVHLFNETVTKEHEALEDAKNCCACFKKLYSRQNV